MNGSPIRRLARGVTFCRLGNLALWHVIGNIYTCQHCAERHKLKVKDLRKVEVQQ